MTAPFERGPRSRYQIVWKSGHVEELEAHQVSYPTSRSFLRDVLGSPADSGPEPPQRVQFHGEFDGHWQLVLSALADDISSIRNLSTCGEGRPA